LPEDENEDQAVDEQQSTRPFWSGTISFGLVSIPVSLFPANRQSRVGLRMLGPRGKPLARRYYAPSTGRELSADQMVRGYEIEKNKYVVVTDEELDRLAPERSRDIDLQRFVDANAIPPLYFERAYFLTPSGASTKAYRLLAAIMEQTHRAGIATFVMRGKEYLVAILSENGILRAETMRFFDEIRSAEDVGLPKPEKVDNAQVRRFSQDIEKLAADDISSAETKDDSSERLLKMARQKEAKHEDVLKTSGAGKQPKVVDILTVLRNSLAKTRAQKEPASAPPPSQKPASDLKGLSRAELYEKAKSLNIAGRSGMSKEQLIDAIQRVA